MGMSKYWIYQEKQVKGPFTVDAIKEISGFKNLKVCLDGTKEWQKATDVAAFKDPPQPAGWPHTTEVEEFKGPQPANGELVESITTPIFKISPRPERRTLSIMIKGTKEDCDIIKEEFSHLTASHTFVAEHDKEYNFGFYLDTIDKKDAEKIKSFILENATL